jgi:hypothetical protein
VYVLAGLLGRAGVLGDARWLGLHLALLGDVSQLVLGAGQFFVAAFLATEPLSLALVRAQLTCWNVGAILVALGAHARRRDGRAYRRAAWRHAR